MATFSLSFKVNDAEFHWDGANEEADPGDVDGMAVAATLKEVAAAIEDGVLRPGSFGSVVSVVYGSRRLGRWEVRGD